MTIPLDPQKMYVTPNTGQPTHVHSGQGEQFAAWSVASMGDLLEVVEDASQALAKLGQPGQWLQVRDMQGHIGWVNAARVDQAYFSPVTPGPVAPSPSERSFAPVTPVAPVVPQPPAPQPLVPTPPIGSGTGIFVHTTLDNGQWIRATADLNSAAKDDVTIGDKLEILGDAAVGLAKLGKYPEWIQVRSPRGIIGWAAAWYLERYPEYLVWTDGHALAGLHGPTETWADRWNEAAFEMIQRGRIEAVKMMASNNLHQQPQLLASIVSRLRGIGVRFIMARLFAKFEGPRTPQDFVDEVKPDALALYNLGVRYFEVHNEPNLHFNPGNPEGMFVAWQNGAEFGDFFQQTVAILRQLMPEGKFGWPGLSPAFEQPKQIYRAETFMNEGDAAVRAADFVCMHAYWGPGGSDYLSAVNTISAFCKKYPDKLIFVTEFANTNAMVSKDVKGREYAMFYSQVRKLPRNLGGVFSYALASAGNDPDQMWADSQIAELVGQRSLS